LDAGGEVPPAVSLVDALRDRVTALLEQNSLLFDEILVLREQVKAREIRIEELQGKRLAAV
jgi:cell division septum initiation protein DivIVA